MKNTASVIGLAILLAGCGKGQEQQAPPPPQVGYVVVREEPVTLSAELPGRTSAYETSDVRPQVNGLILKRLNQEGDTVRAGQALYRIDPSPYEAQAANARAGVAKAQANIASTAALSRRYAELVKINAISKQDAENAVASAGQARADVTAQRAALRTAQIDLGRTLVKAPISGRIGRSAFTTGALVSAAQADPLTTIQRLDPIYVDIQQSSADLLRLRQQIASGALSRGGGDAKVRLKLEDGSTYAVTGTLRFADVTVDPTTGTQVIRAMFSNPQGLLLPGMFVRAELVEGTKQAAILVPQRAVTRDEKGQATVMVVGPDNKLQPRTLTAPRTVGDKWLVTSGLKAGDRVVMEGGMMAMPGSAVTPVPFKEGAPPAGQQQQPAPAEKK